MDKNLITQKIKEFSDKNFEITQIDNRVKPE